MIHDNTPLMIQSIHLWAALTAQLFLPLQEIALHFPSTAFAELLLLNKAQESSL